LIKIDFTIVKIFFQYCLQIKMYSSSLRSTR